MPPNKGFETLKNYIVVLKNNKNNSTKMFYPDKINCQMCTYIINDLTNDVEYTVYIISTNDQGVSKKSNIINIIPYSGKIPPKPEKKTVNITCLKNGNYKEDKYCRVQKVLEPNIDLIEYKDVLEKLKNSQNKYNFDLKL
jgi:molybdopterin/thiamine biosynthesis adenylyltransferase